jgi:hypothetical protein
MKLLSRQQFVLRPHDEPIGFESNERRYFRYAKSLLPQLEDKCRKVVDAWPVPRGEPVRDAESSYPELSAMIDERDQLSDSIRVYAAMAVEGFLNWYGVLRLGEAVFNEHFERLSLVTKAKTLLLVCDSLTLTRDDPLLAVMDKVAQSRNALVHPKAREVLDIRSIAIRPHSRIPETARGAVENMELFFTEFVAAIPAAETLVPRESLAAGPHHAQAA